VREVLPLKTERGAEEGEPKSVAAGSTTSSGNEGVES